jgi:hypothetical protein
MESSWHPPSDNDSTGASLRKSSELDDKREDADKSNGGTRKDFKVFSEGPEGDSIHIDTDMLSCE